MAFRTHSLTVIAAGALALLLSGCSAGAPDPSASGAGADTVAPAATTVPTDTAAATDTTTDSQAGAPSCDSVLTADEVARLGDEGHELETEPFLLGPVMERMAAQGALVCAWTKPNSDVAIWYARLEVGDAGQAWLTELQADGWLEDTARGDGTYLAPADYDANYQPSVQLDSGVLHFGSYNPILQSVIELQ
ncbi:hypothetical protein ACWGST_13875 [Agromyces sp. NPDC055520]